MGDTREKGGGGGLGRDWGKIGRQRETRGDWGRQRDTEGD